MRVYYNDYIRYYHTYCASVPGQRLPNKVARWTQNTSLNMDCTDPVVYVIVFFNDIMILGKMLRRILERLLTYGNDGNSMYVLLASTFGKKFLKRRISIATGLPRGFLLVFSFLSKSPLLTNQRVGVMSLVSSLVFPVRSMLNGNIASSLAHDDLVML